MEEYGSQHHLNQAIQKDTIWDVFGKEKIDKESARPSKESMAETSLEKYFSQCRISSCDGDVLKNWWIPNGGKRPTWDMIVLSKDHSHIFLVEAKAHKYEISRQKDKLPENASKKKEKNYSSKENCINAELKDLGGLYNGYYQIANRIAYANYVSKHYGLDVTLILLGFVGDTHFKDAYKTKEEFCESIKKAMNALNLKLPMEKTQENGRRLKIVCESVELR